jgi:hypothetical protein
MLCLRKEFKTVLQALGAMLMFAAFGAAQIVGLCNTGQTSATASGCTGVLVPPNPNASGTPHLDGNWELAYPYPSTLLGDHSPCLLQIFESATVNTLNPAWLPNSVSAASEWIMPVGGAYVLPAGWYVYRTKFPVPSVLPSGGVPTGVTINGQLASDNATFWIYLESPARSASCALVSGQNFPVNPVGGSTYQQWWNFSFTNSLPITPGAPAYLFIVIENGPAVPGGSATGLRVEFSSSSTFN